MRSAVDAALAAFDRRFGADAAQAMVQRVEVGRDGALVLGAETAEGPRWLRAEGPELVELLPEEDGALPLAARLDELRREAQARVLAWRPGRRMVLSTQGAEGPAIVKGYRRKRSTEPAARTRAVGDAVPRELLAVPRVWRHDEASEALVLEVLGGARPRLEPQIVETFFRLGEALRRFQSARLRITAARHGRSSELAVLDELAGRVERATNELPSGWGDARGRLGRVSDSLPEEDLVPTHRDLHDGQLVVGGRRLGLLDFDLVCVAEPVLDVANLTAHLSLRALQEVHGATRAGAETLSEALIEGYDPRGGARFFASLRLYQAATFLRLALVYRLRPRWWSLTPTLVRLAERSLDEIER